MARKLILVLAMLILTGLADAAKPKLALASGDDCGCGAESVLCHNDCAATYPISDPAYQACVHYCVVDYRNCWVACGG